MTRKPRSHVRILIYRTSGLFSDTINSLAFCMYSLPRDSHKNKNVACSLVYIRSVTIITLDIKIIWMFNKIRVIFWGDEQYSNIINIYTNIPLLLIAHIIHTYNTRNANNYRPYFCTTNIKQFTILHLGPKLWYSLPHNLTELTSYSSFKTSLKKYLIERAIS